VRSAARRINAAVPRWSERDRSRASWRWPAGLRDLGGLRCRRTDTASP